MSDASGVHPKRLATAVRLSTGGSGPLAVVGFPGHVVSLGWSSGLSAPTLYGDEATYAGAVPGGDLIVRVTSLGVRLSVVYHQVPPASSSVVALRLNLDGLAMSRLADGQLQLADPATGLVSRSTPPGLNGAKVDPRTGISTRWTFPPAAVLPSPGGSALWVSSDPQWMATPGTALPVTMDLINLYPPSVTGLYQDLYQAAAATCPGLSWATLAAIGTIESDNGLSRSRGVASGANFAGAEGPMQFEPGTFAAFADPPPFGGAVPANPYDPADAVYAAARNLCANHAGSVLGLAGAVFAYNHADWYVSSVLTLADAYGEVLPGATSPKAVAVRFALAQLGQPYLWGGNGLGAFDCSGLVQNAYLAAGLALPRGATDQYRATPAVPGGTPLAPGDLVFFGSPSYAHHVGMYLGGDAMIDAPDTGSNVRIESFHWSDYFAATRPAPPTPPAAGP